MTIDLILGTAGHIDHGKTSLIRALTGVDTDRLPEEKQRGITIELGFAELMLGDYRLGIVDVPGHEKFVRNMLAGATGMDVAMLVIAADDSIKPQTREHLEILRLLNLPAGVIVITKCDLVEDDWLELVEEEARELVTGTFLENANVLPVSSTTGRGIEALRDELLRCADRACERRGGVEASGPFRLAIDRTFTLAGHGTVVTGSVSNGSVTVGDNLVIQPGGIEVRVRSLHNHDRGTEEVHRGQRAAVNLVGVHHERIERGHELASPGHLVPSRLLTVRLSMIKSADRPLKDRSRVRLHVGTAEILSRVRLLNQAKLDPGMTCFAQLSLLEPAVTTWNQPYVIRSESPVHTIGGGQVLDTAAERIRKPTELVMRYLHDWLADDPYSRASAALFFAGMRGWNPDELPRTAGIDDVSQVVGELQRQGLLVEVDLSHTRQLILHRDNLELLCQRILETMRRLHEAHPLRMTLERTWLNQRFDYLEHLALLDVALSRLANEKLILQRQRGLTLKGHGPKLSNNETKLLEWLIQHVRKAGLETPSVSDMQQAAARNQQTVPQLLALAATEGELAQVGEGYFLHQEVLNDAKDKIRDAMADGGLTLSQIREILNTTRKYAVPLCEYLDRVGFTRRDGDLRYLSQD